MARYIDAEQFEKRLVELFMEPRYMHDEDNYYTAMSIAIDEIRHAPTAAVLPRVEVAEKIFNETEKIFDEIAKMFSEKQRSYENSHQSGKARQMMVARFEVNKLHQKLREASDGQSHT